MLQMLQNPMKKHCYGDIESQPNNPTVVKCHNELRYRHWHLTTVGISGCIVSLWFDVKLLSYNLQLYKVFH